MKKEPWSVSVTPIGDTIHVVCGRKYIYSPPESEYVRPPNWLERILGISHQAKVDRAISKVQAICDKKNAEDIRGKKLSMQYHKQEATTP